MSTKELFLENLGKALRKLICDRLYEGTDAGTRGRLTGEIDEFIAEYAAECTFDELRETFVSAESAMSLFFAYQDARRICGETDAGIREDPVAAGSEAVPSHKPLLMGGDLWEDQATGMIFVWVPGGVFRMGSGPWDDQGAADEKPVHEVWLDSFWVGRYPVTVGQYLAFAENHPEHLPEWMDGDLTVGALERYDGFGDSPPARNTPIVGISWHDAGAFARWLSDRTGHFFRLPTEAQWEFTARSGGVDQKYPGGRQPEPFAWFADNSGGRLHPVGEKEPNGLGIYDMSGNVCEWCLDVYARHAYDHHAPHNPAVLSGEGGQVVRGGSWRYGARDIRCADRGHYVGNYRDGDLGFRLVRMG